MRLGINDPLWQSLWDKLRQRYWYQGMSKRKLEETLLVHERIVVVTDADSRWEAVELPDGEDLVLLKMRYM